jgi:1-aminocyclopropane-1-carboxylate deaminase/D-cysteine desulfhydrase-like pyridoxal-dependent ACC family enzyme
MTYPVLTTTELRRAVQRLPRVPLSHLPTPLDEAPRFAKAIGAGRVFIKRDDCTGLLLGGNKARHNEFLLGDALAERADLLVWGAGEQSNNCRQTAAACAKLGLECRLYLSRGRTGGKVQGNLLLDRLVGAHVELVDAALGPELDDLLAAKAREFRAAGRRPYVWDRHRGRPIAAVSYALVMAEIADQMRALGLEPGPVYVSSCGATGAGVMLGQVALGLAGPVNSIAPIAWPWNVPEDLTLVANRAAELMGLPHRLTTADFAGYTEDYLGTGYGVPSPVGQEALRLLATTEGILLDPCYTAKAMAALIADMRGGRVPTNQPVVFIHTGGLPLVFAVADEVLAAYA